VGLHVGISKGQRCAITLAPGRTLQSRVSHDAVLGRGRRCVGGDAMEEINTDKPRQTMAPAAEADEVGIGQDESKGVAHRVSQEEASYG
jgi:hypothetical protein